MSASSLLVKFGIFMLLGGFVGVPLVLADTIAIIGTGDVAKALGPEFAALGHDIIYGSRDPSRDSVSELVVRTGHGASAATPATSSPDWLTI